MMPTLLITRGLPGAGKTTYAKKWVAEDPRNRKRVNRDDLGIQLHGRRFYEDKDLFGPTEKALTIAHHAQIEALLRAGYDVICDDTNLVRKFARDLRDVAARAGAEFEIVDMLDVPLETVYAQNEKRLNTPAYVPPSAIKRMLDRHTGRNAYEVPLSVEPSEAESVDVYVPDMDLPPVVLVDIDGTTALMNGRGPFEWHRVGEDLPNQPVIDAVRALWAAGNDIIFCSGRDAVCRPETEEWIDKFIKIPYEALFMRPEKDNRKDSIVKREIFDNEIRGRWRVVGVFDDRDQVVRMWRSLGLTVFQVAEGKF
jgi:predicted kinase